MFENQRFLNIHSNLTETHIYTYIYVYPRELAAFNPAIRIKSVIGGETVKRLRTGTVRIVAVRQRDDDDDITHPDQGVAPRRAGADIMSSPGLLNRHTIICAAPIPTAAFN